MWFFCNNPAAPCGARQILFLLNIPKLNDFLFYWSDACGGLFFAYNLPSFNIVVKITQTRKRVFTIWIHYSTP